MNINGNTLVSQARSARRSWRTIDGVEQTARLPRCTLYAVGSRETNLQNIRGDGGHGHGVFQLDDRWHQIGPGFDADVTAQATTAAAMLAASLRAGRTLDEAFCLYNSGQTTNAATTGRDYGTDVCERRGWLATHLEPPYTGPLALGSAGTPVSDWQAQMRWRGWHAGGALLAVDGQFGPLSDEVARGFQSDKNLQVDGIVGPITWLASWSAPVTA